MPKHVAPELVAETVRFSAKALRHKAAELERAAEGAETPAAALAALSECLRTDALIELAEPLQRAAEGLPLYPGSSADALAGFGEEADTLRALLAEREATAAE